jgi:hypothetical protein
MVAVFNKSALDFGLGRWSSRPSTTHLGAGGCAALFPSVDLGVCFWLLGAGPVHTYSGPWGETTKRALVVIFFSFRMHYISRETEYITYIDGLLNYKTPTRHIFATLIPENHVMIEGIDCSYTKDRSSKCQKVTIISSLNLQNKQPCHN